jgi:hypothetical protein
MQKRRDRSKDPYCSMVNYPTPGLILKKDRLYRFWCKDSTKLIFALKPNKKRHFRLAKRIFLILQQDNCRRFYFAKVFTAKTVEPKDHNKREHI